MNTKELVKKGAWSGPISDLHVKEVISLLKYKLPQDYLKFIREHNGGEGEVGKSYLKIWRIEELSDENLAYNVDEYAPNLFLFGSNGAGEGFGFDFRKELLSIVVIPFIGLDWKNAIFMGNTFSEFLDQLKKGIPFTKKR